MAWHVQNGHREAISHNAPIPLAPWCRSVLCEPECLRHIAVTMGCRRYDKYKRQTLFASLLREEAHWYCMSFREVFFVLRWRAVRFISFPTFSTRLLLVLQNNRTGFLGYLRMTNQWVNIIVLAALLDTRFKLSKTKLLTHALSLGCVGGCICAACNITHKYEDHWPHRINFREKCVCLDQRKKNLLRNMVSWTPWRAETCAPSLWTDLAHFQFMPRQGWKSNNIEGHQQLLERVKLEAFFFLFLSPCVEFITWKIVSWLRHTAISKDASLPPT